MDENIGRNFSPLNVSACFSTTRRAMNKWIAQSNSAHQIGLVPTLHGVLIVGWWCCTEGWRFNQVWAEFLCHAIFCFGLYLHIHWSYGQTEDMGGFSASNWSRTDPPRFSNCSWKWWYRGLKKLAEFLTLGNWRCFWLYLHNHWPYGKTEDTGGFSASNWSKTDPPRYSDCSLLVLHEGMKMCGRNFLLSDFGYVLANLATTNKAMDEWRLRLDSADQKGPEINLKGILIVVEGCFTAEISTTCFCSLALKPHNPQTSNASSWLQDPTLPANWHCVPRCLEGGSSGGPKPLYSAEFGWIRAKFMNDVVPTRFRGKVHTEFIPNSYRIHTEFTPNSHRMFTE
jgi:hypothetical protein